jgi:hypothetical protein
MMRYKSNSPRSFVKMEQARQLMDRGYHQESLILALDALLQELNQLRDSLMGLKMVAQSEFPASVPDDRDETPPSGPYWVPVCKPRIMH